MFAMSMMIVQPPPPIDINLDFRMKAQTIYEVPVRASLTNNNHLSRDET
jgi:hypothetical protein